MYFGAPRCGPLLDHVEVDDQVQGGHAAVTKRLKRIPIVPLPWISGIPVPKKLKTKPMR